MKAGSVRGESDAVGRYNKLFGPSKSVIESFKVGRNLDVCLFYVDSR